MTPDAFAALIADVAAAVIDHADELSCLDQAIGDGDHGVNLRRGFQAVAASLPQLRALSVPEALEQVGTTLIMTVGGASGPLFGTACLTLGRTLPAEPDRSDLAAAATRALDAVRARGRAEAGQKTLVDVLVPICGALAEGAGPVRLKAVAAQAAEATIPMQALRGRAAFLGPRSIGHMDPGARSTALMIGAAADAFQRAREPA